MLQYVTPNNGRSNKAVKRPGVCLLLHPFMSIRSLKPTRPNILICSVPFCSFP